MGHPWTGSRQGPRGCRAAPPPRSRESGRGARALLVGIAALAAASTPAPAAAQAICSAPHSSPTLARSGSLATLPAGAGWAQVSVFRRRSSEFFNPLGDRQPFLADSRFRTRSLFFTGAVGVAEGVELWGQVPLHHLSVEADGAEGSSSGLGDVRFAARVGPELVGLELPLAVRLGVKVPGSDFPVDASVLPLTEGQTDVELAVESGRTLLGEALYAVGWVGWRWRRENGDTRRKPGDELFGHAAVGGARGDLTWELGVEALRGRPPRDQGLVLVGEGRRLVQLLPTLGYRVGPGRLELTTQVPLLGRNLPAGVGVSVGYRTAWGL